MSLLLPEMPKELLDWDGERRIIKFPWNAPVCMVPYGPDKAPWRGQYRRRMEPLETLTLRVSDGPAKGAYGTLHMNLVINDNGEVEDRDKPNMHLNGYGDMYLDVHFGIHYPLDDEVPADALVDPDDDYDEDPRWPKEDGKPVPYDDPRIPRWARPWDEVANGGFPIPEDMIADVALQLAFKKHSLLNPLVQRWKDVVASAEAVVARSPHHTNDMMKLFMRGVVLMCYKFKHQDVDHENTVGTYASGTTASVLMPRTVHGLKAMLNELDRVLRISGPTNPDKCLSIGVEESTEDLTDLGAPHRTMEQEVERLETLIRRMQTGSAFDPAEEGFSCATDLYNWARGERVGKTFPADTLRTAASVAMNHLEKNYPSREKLEAQKRDAVKLARTLTKKMSDEDVAKWFEKENELSKRRDVPDIAVVGHDDEAANKKARELSQLLPVLCMDLSEPARLICNERYGQCELPNGQRVLQPVADAYIKVLTQRRDRGIASRTWRAKNNAAWLATRPDASPLPRPEPVRDPWPQPRPQLASQPKSGAGHSDHVDAADLAAQTTRNKEEAEKQREVRRQAEAAAAAKQPRAYTAAGQSHREGAPKWGDEVPDAGDKAKRDATREASKEASAKRRAEKKAAERANVEHRLRQFEQIRIGEAIGGSK